MSFRDVRASRASRQPKSYVLSSASAQAGRDTESSIAPGLSNASAAPGGEHSELSDASIQDANRQDVAAPTAFAPSTGLYADLPPVLSIKKSKKKGRGLWTKAGINAGTTIFSVRPHVHVLSRSQLSLFCTSCCESRPSKGLKKCTKCKMVYYCGSACQNRDWLTHKLECEALRRWAASAPSESAGGNQTAVAPEAVRCLARIIWRRKKMGSGSSWWKEINEMQSHRDGLAQSMVDTHVHLAHALIRYMDIKGREGLEIYGLHSIGELVDLISKFTSNSFTLATPSLSPIGVSVSPLAALINHSCDPNVAVVFPRSSTSVLEEPAIHVIAIQDIPPDTELFTSYIDITLPTAQRQKDLKETYNFTCACCICSPAKNSAIEDWRERMWCPEECGGTCPFPSGDDDIVRCSRCQAGIMDVERMIDVLRVGQEVLDKATADQFSDPETALWRTQNIIRLLTGALPPSAHPLLALHQLHQSLLISTLPANASQDQLNETICAAASSVAGLMSVLRPGHPVRAVALAELGKLLAVDEPDATSEYTSNAGEASSPVSTSTSLSVAKGVATKYPPTGPARLQLAVQTLQQAHTELLIGFGREGGGGEVGRALREILVGLEKELAVWHSGIRDALGDALAERQGSAAK
ncbi:SET domain-containing protein [Phellopilus nigrolimitatus]|nr:SET domain-containing protein [Phellopilus nigrolimitatus]